MLINHEITYGAVMIKAPPAPLLLFRNDREQFPRSSASLDTRLSLIRFAFCLDLHQAVQLVLARCCISVNFYLLKAFKTVNHEKRMLKVDPFYDIKLQLDCLYSYPKLFN